MTISAAIHHVTHYKYDRPVMLGPQTIRLRPAPHCRTKVLGYSLKLTPANHFVNWQQDPHGNWQARFVFPEKVTELKIEVDLTAALAVINPFDFFIEPYAEQFPFAYEPGLKAELAPYLDLEPLGPRLAAFMDALPAGPVHSVTFLVSLIAELRKAIRYVIRMEPGVQRPEETLELASGSCRDFGLAARPNSSPPRPRGALRVRLSHSIARRHRAARGAEGNRARFHRSARLGRGLSAGRRLDRNGRDLGPVLRRGPFARRRDAALPVRRSHFRRRGAGQCRFPFRYARDPRRRVPRITLPFSDAAWEKLDALGERVDADLVAHDVRLTMGGEPTFVSIDDFESEEWNTAAVGPTKRAFADKLIRRLRTRFAQGGMLHYGQGKWYPGESLPRWGFSVYWRKDGEPIWKNPGLIAEVGESRAAQRDVAAIDDAQRPQAERLAAGVAERLGIEADYVHPAYEDPAAWLLKEGNLPENADPLDPKLEDAEERNRMIRTFARGLTKPSGYVLPVQRWNAEASGDPRARWLSEKWTLRRGKLFLVPGDSPVGYRLPLSSLPWVPPASYPFIVARDPFEDREPLPAAHEIAQQFERGPELPGASRQERIEQEAIAGAVRTAVSVESRDGVICVFMPPVESLEDYLELLAAVEASAEAAGAKVHIEGYPPPQDPRINVVKVTPDPGVIEVNVHPAASWRAAVETTKGLYEDARQVRLGADKFMTDGRHTGTGGGNHVVLGGATPADSPFLRRPDLLKSLSSIGSGILRCPISFPACSSGRRARRRASTKRAMISFTSSKSPWRNVPRPGAQLRRSGSSIGCSAIFWSTSPAIRIALRSASTSFIRPTVRPGGSGFSNSAPSKCRPTRA